MPKRTSVTGSELFIVDNSDEDWKVLRYLHDWCQIAKGIDIATGYFEIGAFLALKDEWQRSTRTCSATSSKSTSTRKPSAPTTPSRKSPAIPRGVASPQS